MDQLLSAINYCHKRKVVHRDLKPENVLVSRGKDNSIIIKVIDFGTAEVFFPNKRLKETFGTCYYIAPEVLLHCYTEKCDVWSCGVILYILLSGFPPFSGKSDDDILKAVLKTHFSFNCKLSIYIL